MTYEEQVAKAYELYFAGVKPSYSTGICESITAGYGKLDYLGYFEYPLEVDQDTWHIIGG